MLSPRMSDPPARAAEAAAVALSFRNYVAFSAELAALPRKPRHALVPSLAAVRLVQAAKAEAKRPPRDDEPVLIAPKRANWDLKRDCERRLRKLDKLTQKAIQALAKSLNPGSDEEAED